MLEIITSINTVLNNFIWGVPAMACIIGVGLYLALRTRFIQIRQFGYSMKNTIGRILEKQEAEGLYRDFGKALANCPNWQLYLLSSHTEFERTFGRMADKKRKLYNGMIKCELFMYFK